MELKRTSFPEIKKTKQKNQHEENIKPGFQKGQGRPPRKSDRWQENTEEAFYYWLEDIQPRILMRSGRWEVFDPTPHQREVISAIFEQKDGRLRHNMILNIEPRRHGKSTVFAIVCLFFFVARRNFTISLLGNTDQHCQRTMFKKLVDIINHTPQLKIPDRIDPDKCFYIDRIEQKYWGNAIIKQGVSTSTAYGDRLNILWVSDFHANPDIDVFQAVQSSLLDSEDSLIFIDSNADPTGGHVHEFQKSAETNPSIWCSHIEYDDFSDFCEKAPSWIDRGMAKQIKDNVLPQAFQRDILGKRSSLINRLFPEDVIVSCKDSYKIPVDDIQSLVHGRPYVIGGGLDRAKALLNVGGDFTVWTVILKCANLSGEPEYFPLNIRKFHLNTSRAIKAQIKEDHDRYGLTNVSLENYETADLFPALAEIGIPAELTTATDPIQNSSFPELHRIFRDRRIHLPANCPDLISELSTFVYSVRKNAGGSYSFSHSSSKFHDDHVYSLNWAIWSLRNEILSTFTLPHIDCHLAQANRRSACFLMGGSLELYCSQECRAFQNVREMFKEFRAFHALDSELTIVEFYKAYVKADALIQYQGI